VIDNGPMRIALVLLFTLPPALLAACYDPPAVPRTRPLTCGFADGGPEADKCPDGFRCVAGLICVPDQCATDEDCPVPLVCSGEPEFQCALPGSLTDGGIGDGQLNSDAADGGPDVPAASSDAAAGTADAPATDTADTLLPTFDGPITTQG
jgi:hypothetical protein